MIGTVIHHKYKSANLLSLVGSRGKEHMSYKKYRAVKTVVDGHTFDSKREAERYMELKLLVKAGLIKNLDLQPSFPLQDGFTCKGKKYRPIIYKADFGYIENGEYVVEDVKGMETDVFKLKRKMFIKKFGDACDFRIIK